MGAARVAAKRQIADGSAAVVGHTAA